MSFLEDQFLVEWSKLTPELVVPEIRKALKETDHQLDQLAGLDRSKLTFDHVLIGLEGALEPLGLAWGKVNHLTSVCDSEELRDAYNEVLPEVTKFFSEIYLNEGLWDLISTYSETDEAQNLEGIQKRFLEETLSDFKDQGAELKGADRETLIKIEQELAEITQKFSENVLDSTNQWEWITEKEEDLEGLPEIYRKAALEDAISRELATKEEPKWRFSLQAPSMIPLMTYATKEEVRKKVWEGNIEIGRGGDYDNTDLIFRILQLRDKKAKLLGYGDFADATLVRRMAKTGSKAMEFTEDLHQKVKSEFNKEVTELQSYRADKLEIDLEPLEPWDGSYWAEERRQELYDFDEDELRPYFPIDQVLEGMFGIAENIFEVNIKEKPSVFLKTGEENQNNEVEVWHPEVKFYEIRNEEGIHLGSFYADWHPRDSKRGGAWMNYILTGSPPTDDEDRKPHLGLICGNMTPSSSDAPALLSLDEVTTVFHEFGHLLHHLLGDVDIKSLNGIQVAWDFVELPSQFMENFCWERKSLDFFAKHYETGELIPEKLFKKMIAARNYMSASVMMRQLSLGKLDLELHISHANTESKDLDELAREICQDYLTPLKTDSPTMARRFSHIFSSPTGYAAGYYSYKWAEVLDADAFEKFLEDGVLNPETGKAFKEHILSKGNSEDPSVLYRKFRGKDPDLGALLRRSGLSA